MMNVNKEGSQRTAGLDVRVDIKVEASVAHAFKVFTEQWDAWWPREHHLGVAELAQVVLEPRAGGRWFERSVDGQECDWGRVLLWEPPHRVVLSWQIGLGFVPQTDPALASRIEISFVEDGPSRTAVTLIHSDFEGHGEGWESMRDSVSREGGWPGLLKAFARVASR